MDFAQALAVLQQHGARPSAVGESEAAAQRCIDCVGGDDDIGDAPTSSTAAPSELSDVSDAALLRLFLSRQEERVAIYHRFEEGFTLFLQVAEATGYQTLVAKITAEFSAVSAGVNAIEAQLRGRGAATQALADALRAVQALEREKLQLTAQLHIVRHGLAVDALHADGVVDDAAAVAAASRTAPLRAEEAEDLRGQLMRLTARLNDAIDEVRCEIADADEGDDL